jgi:hypothetical protein
MLRPRPGAGLPRFVKESLIRPAGVPSGAVDNRAGPMLYSAYMLAPAFSYRRSYRTYPVPVPLGVA